MVFSIIIPSYNQEQYIGHTLENVLSLKRKAAEKNIRLELLLYDNESNEAVQKTISRYADQIDHLEVKKDNGQYDAINKGLGRCRGDYWTWLNTDDQIDHEGFFRIAEILRKESGIDYIYGSIRYVDNRGKKLSVQKAVPLTLDRLVNRNPGIFQPGSFFRTAFTRNTGLMKSYRCCFDYEYVLRCMKQGAVLYCCDFPVASFRYHTSSKTGSLIPVFIREQLEISRDYGRRTWSFLTWFSRLRLMKHKIFPRG